MAGPTRDVAYRIDPGSGQPWRRIKYDDPITGTTGLSGELVHFGSAPWVWQPICAAAGVTTIADYPPTSVEGSPTGTNTSTTFNFPSGVTTANLGGSPQGLLILITNNTPSGALGQIRRVNSTTGSSGSWVGVVDTWTTTPTSSSTYILLIDCFNYTNLHIKSEYQNSSGTDPAARVIPAFYGLSLDNTGAAVVPYRVHGYESSLVNLGITTGATQSGYSHAQLTSYAISGAIGAKVRLTAAPGGGSGGNITLWACAS